MQSRAERLADLVKQYGLGGAATMEEQHEAGALARSSPPAPTAVAVVAPCEKHAGMEIVPGPFCPYCTANQIMDDVRGWRKHEQPPAGAGEAALGWAVVDASGNGLYYAKYEDAVKAMDTKRWTATVDDYRIVRLPIYPAPPAPAQGVGDVEVEWLLRQMETQDLATLRDIAKTYPCELNGWPLPPAPTKEPGK